MKKVLVTSLSGLLVIVFSVFSLSQSGGPLVIQKSTIAGGGGRSSGGTFSVDGTLGQPVGGTSSRGGNLAVSGGLWAGISAPVASVTPTPVPTPTPTLSPSPT